ncbi:hypothetical protein [Nostoc sp. CALU 546]
MIFWIFLEGKVGQPFLEGKGGQFVQNLLQVTVACGALQHFRLL